MSTEKKVRIIIDSSADVKDNIKDKCTVLPMKICFGDTEYTAGVDIDNHGFYKMLQDSDVLPVTSQIKPYDYKKAFDKAKAAGESVLVITLSSKLSGTYQSAMIAAEESDAEVYIVDSLTVAIGSGILIELAVALLEQGKSANEIAEVLEEEKKKVQVVALLNTLEYLKKGGRISRATAFAGELLSIKPLVCITDGEVQMLSKARGVRQGCAQLVKEIETLGSIDYKKPMVLGYTGLSDEAVTDFAQENEEFLAKEGKLPEVLSIGSIVGTHAGPDAVAVAYFRK